MKARDLMSRPVISVGPHDTVREAVTRRTEHGSLPCRQPPAVECHAVELRPVTGAQRGRDD
ncbi:MAG TPA: hypothetical protein VFV67_09075 [Actinophytocola sp.]|uniref:hypothetical protein n=1 Tax=Actinophytocola sp. TaxID=1872138 RepID=UPI002DBE4AD7|nr:hypothetical protein [Actinophytocola sp.]HEU5470794.1 hypothetical protein [Actinophytocola sp.]